MKSACSATAGRKSKVPVTFSNHQDVLCKEEKEAVMRDFAVFVWTIQEDEYLIVHGNQAETTEMKGMPTAVNALYKRIRDL